VLTSRQRRAAAQITLSLTLSVLRRIYQEGNNGLFEEESDDPHYADRRNFYRVEKWTRAGKKVDSLLYASKRGCLR
jgi:hypothetical protein